MASKNNKQSEKDRRAKIEEMRKAEAAKQRRRSMGFVVVAVIVGLGLVLAVVIPTYLNKKSDPANKSLSSFGVSMAAASCGAVKTTKGTNTDALRKHVDDGTIEKYDTVPPSSGPHWASPIYPSREFYSTRDKPQMEQLVHNLEHGYTLVWYDSTIKGAQLATLKDVAASARTSDMAGPGTKFIVSPWDDAYGTFPAGEFLTHVTSFRGLRAYDIAAAISASTTLPPDLVSGLWDQIEPNVEQWRAMGVFGPAVEVPADASAQDKLLAMTGRRPPG